ncbi:hypothetical protein MOKP64_45110 [Mycobacterium avium subsp. hominissuis]
MAWIYDDGGRQMAGFKGDTGDCVTRAIAIATGLPYRQVYDMVNEHSARERGRRNKRTGKNQFSRARTGVFPSTTRKVMADLGWRWVPLMGIGTGCRVHLRADELPTGRVIAEVSRHTCAVIDGVIHDTYDPSRGGTRCVYGVYIPPREQRP